MSYIVVDVETDGPIIGINSIVCFGAVILDDKLDKTFYGQIHPISPNYNKESLAISGFTRNQHETFNDPYITMTQFKEWIRDNSKGKPILISDNNQYDGSWINYYFHRFIGFNPFMYSSRRIGDLICGYKQDLRFKWKDLRTTLHDHNPVNDAMANASVLQQFNGIFKFY